MKVVQRIHAPLDVTMMMIEENGMVYAMTLLAFCGFYGQKDMAQLLLNENAGIII